GQRNAPYWLGLLYWNGDGVEKNNAEAARWWRMAVERGRVDAARLLGDEAAARFADAAQSGGEWRAPADEAKRWYEITLAQDSSPENQAHARNMLGVLRQVMQRGAPG
ncbi:MAG TPA: hypothetical protein PLS69_14830, partial [Terricaulis sp.]|nr:hypothetical protein [Terricaulis sp.]